MKFCPKCKTRLRHMEGVLICPKCEYREDGSAPAPKPTTQVMSEFNVLSEDDQKEILPTTTINCPKCSHDKAAWWMLQTRSADEPTTQFYRCVMCEHTWRDYS